MTVRAWFCLAVALAGAWLAVVWLSSRGPRTAGGQALFAGRSARWGLLVLVAMALLALAAPLVTSYAPARQLDIVALQNRPPSLLHPLGTDLYSRDVWSRLVYGARVSLAVGALGMLLAVTLGSTVGAVAGFSRGAVDSLLMRLTDVGLAVPRIFVIMVLAAVWEHLSLPLLVAVIGLTSWFVTGRLVRAEVLSVSERPYVAAARALGLRSGRLVLRHVLPNAAAPIIISAALETGGVMLLESALSFLGFGVPAPMASWGSMIGDARNHIRQAPWAAIAPGLAIALVVMACNAVGESLRERLGASRAVD